MGIKRRAYVDSATQELVSAEGAILGARAGGSVLYVNEDNQVVDVNGVVKIEIFPAPVITDPDDDTTANFLTFEITSDVTGFASITWEATGSPSINDAAGDGFATTLTGKTEKKIQLKWATAGTYNVRAKFVGTASKLTGPFCIPVSVNITTAE